MLKLAFGAAVLLMCVTDRYGGLLNFATPFPVAGGRSTR